MVFVKQKQGLIPTFVTQKQKTGNVQEMTWYDDNTEATEVVWDGDIVSAGHIMVWDKNVHIGLVKQKQSSIPIFVKQKQGS